MARTRQYTVEITHKHPLAGHVLFNAIVVMLALWLGFWQTKSKINDFQVMAASSGCGQVCVTSISSHTHKSPKRMVEITPPVIVLVAAWDTPFVASGVCLWDGQHLLASDSSLRLLQRPPPLSLSLA